MGTPLSIAIRLLPTPRVQAHGAAAAPEPPDLPEAVALLKTPTAQLASNGGSQHPDKRRAGGHGPTLADQVEHLLPTPTAMDSHGARNATSGRSSLKPSVNNDGWTLSDVFWTGESTRPPSGAGKPSPGDLLPRQLTLDEAEYPG